MRLEGVRTGGEAGGKLDGGFEEGEVGMNLKC